MAYIPFLNNAYFTAKVGIGTDSPDAKLDVEAGGIGGTSGDSATAAIFRAGRQNLYLQTQRTADGTDWNNTTFKLIAKIDSTSHQSINFVNDASYNEHIDIYTGNQVFNTRFNANGNVGIGTTSPLGKLQVNEYTVALQGNQGVHGEVSVFADDGDESLFLGLKDSAYPNRGWAFNPVIFGVNSDLQIKEHGATGVRMTIQSGGNVGIGTTSPDTKLTVKGAATAGLNQTINIETGGVAAEDGGSMSFTLGSFLGSYPNWRIGQIGAVYESTNSFDGALVFKTSTAADGGTEKMRIASDGAIKFNTYGAGTLVTDSSGNITVSSGGGAGGPYLPLTAGSGFPLTGDLIVSASGNTNLILQNPGGSGNSLLWWKDSSGGNDWYFGQTAENANLNLYNYSSSLTQVQFKTNGTVTFGSDIQVESALLSNQENTDVDSAAAEVVAQVSTTYTAAFFDFVVKKTTNVRSGTVYACHDGTSVVFTETSTNDLGDTSDVTLSVDISGGNMRLLATVTSDDWSVKSLIRAI